MKMKRLARALLIGVESYAQLGPDKQLRAGRNDVLAFWKVCRRLGFEPENIHVFTSPVLDVDDLVWAEQELADELHEYHGKTEAQIAEQVKGCWFPANDTPRVFLSEATGKAILGSNGLQWIAQRVAGPADRILTYSGHGTTIDHNGKAELALCPSDLNLDQPESYLSIDTFKQALKDVDDNLTVVLDCCFAQSAATPRGTHRVATLSGRTSDKPLEIDASDLGAHVFCASGPSESSYQALIGGYWYSAFSWAMTVALEQWRICRKHKAHAMVTHNELLFRARMLLEALSFPQHPVLLDHLGNRPVFGQLDAEEEPEGQVRPDFRYTLYMGLDTKSLRLADIFVVGANKSITLQNDQNFTYRCTGDGATGGTEYWWYSNDNLSKIDNIGELNAIYVEASNCKPGSTVRFNWGNLIAKQSRVLKPASETWSATPTSYSGGTSYYFSFGDWGLELNVGIDGDKRFLNGVQWYQKASTMTSTIGTTLAFNGKWSKTGAFDMNVYVAETSI